MISYLGLLTPILLLPDDFENAKRLNLIKPQLQGIFCSQRSAQAWAKLNNFQLSDRGPSLDDLSQYFNVSNRREEIAGIHNALNDALQSLDMIKAIRKALSQYNFV